MSLIDLRRQRAPSKSVSCSIDEFIEGAQRYAKGLDDKALDNIVQLPVPETTLAEKGKQPYRKATFTLSEPCIEALTRLSQQTGMSKSHLIRMLITQMDDTQLPLRRLNLCK